MPLRWPCYCALLGLWSKVSRTFAQSPGLPSWTTILRWSPWCWEGSDHQGRYRRERQFQRQYPERVQRGRGRLLRDHLRARVRQIKGLQSVLRNAENRTLANEFPVSAECRLTKIIDFPGTDLVVGEVVQVHVGRSIVVDGKVDVERLRPLLYSFPGGPYLSIGPAVAEAFKVGKTFIVRK